jgi:excisionase family DNA binding protein
VAAPPAPLTRLLTAAEIASMVGVPKDRIWTLTREGKLRAVKLGRRTYRYVPEHVSEDLARLEE